MNRVFKSFAIAALLVSPFPVNAATMEGRATCGPEKCVIVRSVSTLRPSEKIVIIVDFERASMRPLSLLISVPAAVDQKTGLKYGFVKLPEIDPTKRQPREVEFSLPFTKCDPVKCVVRIENDPAVEGHNLQKDFIENMLRFDATVFSFEVDGKESGAGITRNVLAEDYGALTSGRQYVDDPARQEAERRDAWVAVCEPDLCKMEHAMTSDRDGPAREIEIAMGFRKGSGEPSGIVVFVPPEADFSAGVHVEFADVPKFDANGKAYHEREEISFTLPFESCDEKHCVVSIKNGPGNRDLQKYLVENFGARDFFGLTYKVNGQTRIFMEPGKMFTRGYQALQAELKKSQ